MCKHSLFVPNLRKSKSFREERKNSVLPALHQFINCLCRRWRHVWKCGKQVEIVYDIKKEQPVFAYGLFLYSSLYSAVFVNFSITGEDVTSKEYFCHKPYAKFQGIAKYFILRYFIKFGS